MNNEIWQVESNKFDAISVAASGIRVFYLEALRKAIQELEKEIHIKDETITRLTKRINDLECNTKNQSENINRFQEILDDSD